MAPGCALGHEIDIRHDTQTAKALVYSDILAVL